MEIFDFIHKKSSKREVQKNEHLVLSPGDIFYTFDSEKYLIYKLLSHDKAIHCYHVLMYQSMNVLPSKAQLDKLKVFIYHSPISSDGFKDCTILASMPLLAQDLSGYHDYLNQTTEPAFYIPIANQYYKNGCLLSDENRHHEAIDEYTKAIDLFPQFFEAIDNRALSKMDLALWQEALDDFTLSLQLNPNSFMATFYIGKCYIQLGDLMNAKKFYAIALNIDPNHEATIQILQRINNL